MCAYICVCVCEFVCVCECVLCVRARKGRKERGDGGGWGWGWGLSHSLAEADGISLHLDHRVVDEVEALSLDAAVGVVALGRQRPRVGGQRGETASPRLVTGPTVALHLHRPRLLHDALLSSCQRQDGFGTEKGKRTEKIGEKYHVVWRK